MKHNAILMLVILAAAGIMVATGPQSADLTQGKEKADTLTANQSDRGEKGDSATAGPRIIAYYFHTTYRCASCQKIEDYSKEAIETGFVDELQNGTLEFYSVNIDEAANNHFIKDYQLYTKSLVVCDMENGRQTRWKNLKKVWQLIRNKNEFIKYVQDEINIYLKES